jgi:hypothetical protein
MMGRAIYAWGEKKFGEKSSKSEGLHSVRESRTPVKPFKNLEEFKHVPKDGGDWATSLGVMPCAATERLLLMLLPNAPAERLITRPAVSDGRPAMNSRCDSASL